MADFLHPDEEELQRLLDQSLHADLSIYKGVLRARRAAAAYDLRDLDLETRRERLANYQAAKERLADPEFRARVERLTRDVEAGFGTLIDVTVAPEPHHEPGQPRRETREELLAWAQPFPAYPALVIDGLSDAQEDDFLATIREA